jgi:hypothetical protein
VTTSHLVIQQQTGINVKSIVKLQIQWKIMLLICEPNKDTVKTGIWTNIFRVEISAHVDYGNTFYYNKRIYLFILQSLHLICKYTIQSIFAFFVWYTFQAPSITELLFMFSALRCRRYTEPMRMTNDEGHVK